MMMVSLPGGKDDTTDIVVMDGSKTWWQRKTKQEKTITLLSLTLALCIGIAISLPWVYFCYRKDIPHGNHTATDTQDLKNRITRECRAIRKETFANVRREFENRLYHCLANDDDNNFLVSDVSPCGDWNPFKNEKCYKIIREVVHVMQDKAESVCKMQSRDINGETSPKLITIKTKAEQEFLQDYLFDKNNIVDEVWLGLKFNEENGTSKWNDGGEVIYTNWANHETYTNNYCVQMKPGRGQWFKANCQKSNIVVCEKIQSWSLSTIQLMLLNEKLKTEHERKEIQQKLFNAVDELTVLKQVNETTTTKIATLLTILEQVNETTTMKIATLLTILEQVNETTAMKIATLQQMNIAAEKKIISLEHENKIAEDKFRALEHCNETAMAKFAHLENVDEAAIENITYLVIHAQDVGRRLIGLDRKNTATQRVIAVLNRKNDAAGQAILALQQKNEDEEKKMEDFEVKHGISGTKILTLEQLMEESKKNITAMEQSKAVAEKQLDEFKRNPVPIGFIYVQLPRRDSPKELWPHTEWKNVSSDYAGLFFRVEGGNAADFGTIQDDNTRSLNQVTHQYNTYSYPQTSVKIPADGTMSSCVKVGSHQYYGLGFQLSKGEVRPRNEAIKIWQRIK